MNVLIIGMTRGYAGTEKYIISQVRNKPESVNVTILNDKHEQHLAYEDEYASLGIHVLTPQINEKKNPIGFMREIASICEENSINVMIINANTVGVRAVLELFGAKNAGVKKRIVHSHNSSVDSIKGLVNHLLCSLFVRYDFFNLVTKRFACSKVAGEYEFGKKTFKIINNGIDTNAFAFSLEKRERIRKELGLSDQGVVFLHVGRISRQKNTDFMLRTYIKFASQNKDTALIVAGGVDDNPAELEKVKKTLRENNDTENIKWLGLRTDISDLMSGADVFFLPSLFEGLPIVAVEAQCSGLFCVFSDKISTEVELSKNVAFVPLGNDIDDWCNVLNHAAKMSTTINRHMCVQQIKNNCFDIKDCASEYWNLVCSDIE